MGKREKLSLERLVSLLEEELDDPRREGGNLQHNLVDVLVLVLLGVICGCEKWIEIEDYAIANEAWLRNYLELPNGIPSNDTYRRVLERIQPKQLEAAYRKWVLPYVGGCCGKQIAVDGKTICGASSQPDSGKLHIVSAWVKEDQISLRLLLAESVCGIPPL